MESPLKEKFDKTFTPRRIFSQSPQKSFEDLKRPRSLIKVNLFQKLKLQEYMKKLDISPSPIRCKNPFAIKEDEIYSPSPRKNKIFYIDPREPCIEELIDSMLSNRQSPLRKDTNVCAKSLDPKLTNSFLKEMVHIAKHGIKKKITLDLLNNHAKASEAEEFWNNHISGKAAVRWDVFQESFIRFLILSINTSQGYIRKLNWEAFFSKLYESISISDESFSLWPRIISYPNTLICRGKLVRCDDWKIFVETGAFKSTLLSCISNDCHFIKDLWQGNNFTYACGTQYKGQWNSYLREGQGTLTFPSGEIFQGIFFNGLRHGFGIFEGNGYYYKGDWDNDQIHGFGTMNYPNGSTFTGEWEHENPRNGTLKWADGIYTGELNTYCLQGQGKLITIDGDIKKGTWVRGKLNGNGEIKLKNGHRYSGIFVDDYLDGKGALETEEFFVEGWFKKSKPHGFATKKWYNGDIYEGFFLKGKPNGKGCLKNDNGDIYKGDYIRGKLNGKGEFTNNDGVKYEGEFVDHLFHGRGVLKFIFTENKCIYKGEFREGKFHGKGQLKIENIGDYFGDWVAGVKDGAGTLTLHKMTYKGKFVNDIVHGNGSIYFYDGSYYTGEWIEGIPHGRGEALDSDNNWFSGLFINSKPLLKNPLNDEIFEELAIFKKQTENIAKIEVIKI
ncbi:unnamed protein product [Blepharisma stoltei]|uniref:Uncharacterized protein n=1 Tax=Blepharisma stoltei TaxID=1481888 RepID=A0AAU9JUY9_9CILI|nr:unnamed protein product [Blepharisma stoltei]